MDKKQKSGKGSLKQIQLLEPEKSKKCKLTAGRHLKTTEGNNLATDSKNQSTNTRLPKIGNKIESKREAHRSMHTLNNPQICSELQKKRLKPKPSSITFSQLSNSSPEKTVKKARNSDNRKQGSKLVKARRKVIAFKDAKKQEQKLEQREEPTVRKKGKVHDDYEVMYMRTEKVLEGYREREREWENEKATLVEELEDLRRKSMGMALTSCSSYSLNRRHFF